MISNTTMQVKDDMFILCRLFDNKFHCIEFTKDITVSVAAPYFNMNDDTFKKLCTSTYIKPNML